MKQFTSEDFDPSFQQAPPQAPPATGQAPPDEEGGILQTAGKVVGAIGTGIADFVTGREKETRATRELPNVMDLGLDELLGKSGTGMQAAMGTLFSMSPMDQIQFIKNNTDDQVSVAEDEKGNIIVNVGGRVAMLDRPGFSLLDATKLAAQGVAFTPAGRMARAGVGVKTAMGNVARVGGASAATQGVIDVGSQALGRDDEMSVGNIRGGEIAAAGGFGALGQGAMQILSKIMPAFAHSLRTNGLTPEIRERIQREAMAAGIPADQITDDVIWQMSLGKPAPEMAGRAGELEFKTQLTQGQRSTIQDELVNEEALRTRGGAPQKTIQDFDIQTQRPQIQQAADEVAEQITGRPIDNRGGVLMEAVQGAESAADDLVSQAYEAVGDAALSADSVHKLFNATRKAVIGNDNNRLLPITKQLLGDIRKTQRLLVDLKKAGARVQPKHINEIEGFRRKINTYINSADNNQDRAQLLKMKRGLDDFMDESVAKALFEGDQQALNSLKNARTIARDYFSKFRKQTKTTRGGVRDQDKAGQLIEKIVELNPTSAQVLDAILGADAISNKAGKTMIQRFKKLLPKGSDTRRTVLQDGQLVDVPATPGSDGMRAIKQEALSRIIKTSNKGGQQIVSGQKTLNALNDAMRKNSETMRELFTPEDLALIRRFAHHVKRTTPEIQKSRSGTGTGTELIKATRNIGNQIAAALMVTGDPAAFITAQGIQLAGGLKASKSARAAIRPFENLRKADTYQLTPTATVGSRALLPYDKGYEPGTPLQEVFTNETPQELTQQKLEAVDFSGIRGGR